MGFVGVGILVLPHSGQAETASANPGQWLLGTVSVLVACAIWAAGSLYSRRAVRPASPVLSVAIQMIAGGALLMLVAAVTGEFGRFSPMSVSPKSLWAWSYLVVFGSIIAFSAYVWVMRVAAPALVGTYAFVNPVVAVALGTALAGERFEGHTWVGAAVVLVAVAVIICFPQKAGRVT
jgi:drug/metabolite transporter (DMT)-like permease